MAKIKKELFINFNLISLFIMNTKIKIVCFFIWANFSKLYVIFVLFFFVVQLFRLIFNF